MWDGLAAGIEELLKSSRKQCRAVIVLTDGGDGSSKLHNFQSVLSMALKESIPVYTIGLGSGSNPDLPELASRTGGKHYTSATGSDLADIYSTIRRGITGWSFPYCYLEYEIDCPDGTERVVELKLKDYCYGTASQTFRYTAPYMPELFKHVTLSLGSADVNANTEFLLPITLDTPVTGMFSKGFFTTSFDENLLEFLDIKNDGTLLAAKKFSWQRSGQIILIRLEEDVELNTVGGVLFNLRFRSKDPLNTQRTPVRLLKWTFDAYCLAPVLRDGSVLIRAREALLSCQASGPGMLRWSEQNNGYEPTVFDVSVVVVNSGNREINDVRATLLVDRTLVDLISPTAVTQPASPSVIPPSGSAGATWTLMLSDYRNLKSFPVRFRIEAGTTLYDECEILITHRLGTQSSDVLQSRCTR
jgi:hypothetical protein